MKNCRVNLYSILFILISVTQTKAADRLKDFRNTEQKIALLGFKKETVEPEIEKKFLEDLRKSINRYSKSFGTSSISGFDLSGSEQGKYFSPVEASMKEEQKAFLTKVAKAHSIDIVALASISQQGLSLQLELQLFDARIDTLSKVEKAALTVTDDKSGVDQLVYRVMNYIDRDGFVHQTPQEMLQPPIKTSATSLLSRGRTNDDYSVNPSDLAGGHLAGQVNIGGDKRPYWETWWFWSIIGGSLVTAASLSYYFLVVNQPPTAAQIEFRIP